MKLGRHLAGVSVAGSLLRLVDQTQERLELSRTPQTNLEQSGTI